MDAAGDSKKNPEEDRGKSRKESSSSLGVDLVSLCALYGKLLLVHGFSYFMGYYNFSPSWIFVGLIIYVWREKVRIDQEISKKALRAVSENPKEAILARLQDLPSWVFFPDVEKAEWLNKIIKQLWPYIGNYVKDFIKEKIEPSIQSTIQKSLKIATFKFETIELGDVPPKIGGVKVYQDKTSRKEILMDMDIYYSGDCYFKVAVKNFKAGLKDLQLRGTVRVIMKPLINQIPLVGGLQVFFLNNPAIDFNLTNIADILDVPGLADLLRKGIIEQIANMMVLPNKFPIMLANNISSVLFNKPEPVGVLRVNVVEARDLMKKDRVGLLGGKSDPYAVITVGAEEFRTKIINNTVNPVWDFFCEVSVFSVKGQFIEICVLDDDPGKDDEKIGRITVDISSVSKKGKTDCWVSLDEATTGTLHLKISWFTLSTNVIDMYQQMKESLSEKQDLSCAVLVVYIDSVRNLPNVGKASLEPSPFVRLKIANQKVQTKTIPRTNDPVYEVGFCFLVQNPDIQDLSVDVVDQKSEKSLASTSIPLSILVKEQKLSLHRPFPLKSSVMNQPEITMVLELKAMSAKAQIGEETSDTLLDVPKDNSEKSSNIDLQNDQQNGLQIPSALTDINATSDTIKNSSSSLVLNDINDESGLRKRNSKKLQIQLTLRYSMQRQKLIIVVHKVNNLSNLSLSETPDPYVKLYLLTDQSRDSKRKTNCCKSSFNPVFDETFEYSIPTGDLPNNILEVSVCARSSGSLFGRSLILGQIQINLANLDLGKAVTDWFELEETKSENDE